MCFVWGVVVHCTRYIMCSCRKCPKQYYGYLLDCLAPCLLCLLACSCSRSCHSGGGSLTSRCGIGIRALSPVSFLARRPAFAPQQLCLAMGRRSARAEAAEEGPTPARLRRSGGPLRAAPSPSRGGQCRRRPQAPRPIARITPPAVRSIHHPTAREPWEGWQGKAPVVHQCMQCVSCFLQAIVL